MSLQPFANASELLKDGGVDNDDDRQDFHEAILKHGDHDAQVEKLANGVSNSSQNATESLKEQERQAYWEERAHRPTQPYKDFGLDPAADINVIPDTPVAYSKRTHNQIRLIQENNASRAALLGMYSSRFK